MLVLITFPIYDATMMMEKEKEKNKSRSPQMTDAYIF